MLDDQRKESFVHPEAISNRGVDRWARKTLSFLNKSWSVTSRLHIRTWHAFFVLAFVSGTFFAFFMSYSPDIEPIRNASLAQTTVVPPPPPPPLPEFPIPAITFSANPTSVAAGSSSELSWSSANTVSCTASGAWTGTKTLSGNESVTPEQTATYTLTCAGSFGGNVTKSVTVTVIDTTAPTVSISSPANNTSYTTAQTVAITATATDDVAVTKVEFYDGTALKGTDTTSPYSYAWSITRADNGSHSWTAKAYDAAGNSKTSTVVSLTVNIADTTAPTVSISSPTNNTSYTTVQTVTITATASDDTGVTKVEFYDGTTLKSTDTSSPYSFAWSITNADNGSHSWTAKAYDAAGNNRTSSVVTLTVNISSGSSDTTKPTVSLTAPTTGTVVTPGAAVTMTAEASDNTGVARVEFLVNGAVRCTDTASPYTCSWKTPKANAKTYTLQARAADAAGNTETSASVSITATK